ncbi:MAG TPA: HDOD domain-containing protein [Phycisphaerales bacterium]|nr:HDOD domain-containing protein [Phycisphaerales bacterium]
MGRRHEPSRTEQVELILDRVDQLPTLSPIAQKLLSAASPDDVDFSELIKLIETDPSLTGKVLSMCRRADRGLGNAVSSVGQAVTLLGLEAIQSAVLSVEVFELLSPTEDDHGEGGFDGFGHWRGCVSVASACELIAASNTSGGIKPDMAFTAGLLHGLGRAAMSMVLPESYGRVLRVAEQRGVDSATLERELIGLDHHTAGRRLAEHWGLPEFLRDVVWLYDLPPQSMPTLDHRNTIGLVATARALCRRMNMGWFGDFGQPADVVDLAEAFELDPEVVESTASHIHERVAERCAALGMDEITPVEVLLESVMRANTRLASLNRSLSKRSLHASQQKRVLDAIGSFCSMHQGSSSVAETLADIAQSSSELIGGSVFTLLAQSEPGRPWKLFRFSDQAKLLRSEVLEPPALKSGAPVSLHWLTEPSQMMQVSTTVIPWLSQYAGETVEIGDLRIVPLIAGSPGGPAAVLMLDRDIEEAIPSEVQRRALVAAWGAAVAASLRHEQSRTLAEELAERHRDLAEAQIRLAETQSMARLGAMTAGAAHEMNNPLTVIKGYSQVLRTRIADGDLRNLAEKIGQASQEISDLITSLNLIADPPEPKKIKTSIQGVINEAVMASRTRTRMKCASRVSVPSHLPAAMVDPQLLRQALVELVCNAAESGTDEIIEIRVQTDPLDDRLLIMVKDHGRGMPPETLEHAFDPFFSDKPAGRQTGLGLSRARRLVELMGGTVSLSTKLGEGTRALVTLPGWRVPSVETAREQAA